MDTRKNVRFGFVLAVVTLLMVTAFASGLMIGRWTAGSSADKAATPIPDPKAELFKPFWTTWDYLHTIYVDQPVDDTQLMRGAIDGMLNSLGDQHTSYMDPDTYKDATASLEGEYEGIGAFVNTDGDYLTITKPIAGSPAEKVGLQPGDEIIAINGVDMTGTPPDVARKQVLGPRGTKVVLTIRRQDVEAPFDVEITRASINVPSVESKMLEGNVAYVSISTFGTKTADELHTALEGLLAQKPVGLILDLRNNAGGELKAAVSIASEFLSQGLVLAEEYGDGRRVEHPVQSGGLATDIPMVVLINKYSASASEVVAGAIQDDARGKLVGETSFGKGSVQNWIPLENGVQGAVRITIAKWLTPSGRSIHKLGLTPDVVVPLTEEDFKNKKDPQLDKAVELLVKP